MVDTLIIIPNQNLFRVANKKTTFADAFAMADQVLYSGVACITDLMVKEGLINLDFADVRAVMREMGKAMMGTGEASGEKRALTAAEAAIANPLIDDASMKGAKGLLISITGGRDLTLYEVDEAASRIRGEVDPDANIIVGATFDESLEGVIRVSVVATGIDNTGIMRQPENSEKPARAVQSAQPAQMGQPAQAAHTVQPENALKELASKMRAETARVAERLERERTPQPAAAPARTASPTVEFGRPCGGGGCDPAARRHDRRRLDSADADEAVAVRAGPADLAPPVEAPPPKTFIPPAPERTARAPRMPRIDELPLPAQAKSARGAAKSPKISRKSSVCR